MKQSLVKISLITLAAIASIGIIVAASTVVKRMGLLTQAEVEFAPLETPSVKVTDKTAIVNWETGKPVVGMVNYGSSESNLSIPAFEANATTNHQVELTRNLKSDTTYYYEIVAGEQHYKEDDKGKSFSFHTLPSAKSADTYPECEIEVFKSKYGLSSGDISYDPLYDIDGNGTITTDDFFQCIKVKPPK